MDASCDPLGVHVRSMPLPRPLRNSCMYLPAFFLSSLQDDVSDALFMSSGDADEARAQEAAAAPKPLAADESTAEEREVGG